MNGGHGRRISPPPSNFPNGGLNLHQKEMETRARKAENQASSPVHQRFRPKIKAAFSLSLGAKNYKTASRKERLRCWFDSSVRQLGVFTLLLANRTRVADASHYTRYDALSYHEHPKEPDLQQPSSCLHAMQDRTGARHALIYCHAGRACTQSRTSDGIVVGKTFETVLQICRAQSHQESPWMAKSSLLWLFILV